MKYVDRKFKLAHSKPAKERVSVALPKKIYEKVVEIAVREEKSMTSVLEALITKSLEIN